MEIAHLLNTTATVQAVNTGTQTTGGGVSVTTSDKKTGVPCRIRTLSARERERLGREGKTSTHRVYMTPDQSVAATDRLIIGGKTYDVEHADDPHGLGEHLEIDCIFRG